MDLVQFHDVSKRYRLGERFDARETVARATGRLLRREPSDRQDLWALRDVGFAVGEGEALGIVGRNGSGKSTVLKILAGITPPTSGHSRTRGRVASLLEVGTGFHPELTGRENVFLNGAILGMSRRDIIARFDQIVDFSGVERFLDTPVKRYSSGMYLRLAFAVASHLEPDVLVVDEILAVGDAEFQRKCLTRMSDAEEEGRTLVFVSHDLQSLSRLCARSIWLDAGRVRDSGPTAGIVRDYLNSGLTADHDTGDRVLTGGPVTVRSVRVVNATGRPEDALVVGDGLRIEVDFDLAHETPGLDLALVVTTEGGVRVLDELLSERTSTRLEAGRHRAAMAVPPLLNTGTYTVGLWFGTPHEDFLDEPVAAAPFTVHGSPARPERVVALGLPFEVQRLDAQPGKGTASDEGR